MMSILKDLLTLITFVVILNNLILILFVPPMKETYIKPGSKPALGVTIMLSLFDTSTLVTVISLKPFAGISEFTEACICSFNLVASIRFQDPQSSAFLFHTRLYTSV